MAWANGARCLHCGQRLPLYRKFADADFCSAAHRKAFQEDQAALAMQRLVETQQQLTRAAARPALSEVVGDEPPAMGVLAARPDPYAGATPDLISVEPIGYDPDARPYIPRTMRRYAAGLRCAGRTAWRILGTPAPRRPAETFDAVSFAPKHIWPSVDVRLGSALKRAALVLSQWKTAVEGPRPVLSPEGPVEVSPPPVHPSIENALVPSLQTARGQAIAMPSGWASAVAVQWSAPVPVDAVVPAMVFPRSVARDSMPGCGSAPLQRIAFPTARATAEVPASCEPAEHSPQVHLPALGRVPRVSRLSLLAGVNAVDGESCREFEPAPVLNAGRTWLPVSDLSGSTQLRAAEVQQLTLESATVVQGAWVEDLQPLRSESASPVCREAMRATAPARVLVAGRVGKMSVSAAAPGAVAVLDAEPVPHSSGPEFPVVQLQIRPGFRAVAEARAPSGPPSPKALRTQPSGGGPIAGRGGIQVPEISRTSNPRPLSLARMVRLTCPMPPQSAPPQSTGAEPEPFHTAPLIPPSRLKARGTAMRLPVLDLPEGETESADRAPVERPRGSKWSPVIGSVRHAPVHLRVFGLLAILCATGAIAPELPKAAVEKTASSVNQNGGVGGFVNGKLTEVKQSIAGRAGLELVDDFRTGLDNWEGRRDLTRTWSYDPTGFVRPGPLALYRPSMSLNDYNVEFLGLIDRKALGWVVRAQDFSNYYALKLAVVHDGPLPVVGLIRYAVIDGKEGRHTAVALPLTVRGDTMYRVSVEVRGPDFVVRVQDQLVDFWSDGRLRSGGVGFFSGKGEQSRVRWIQVSHQYDALGRLCAYLTPFAMASYNLQSTNGSWK